ncbi:hypothetical protein KSP35_20860 [Aquihabitans sp. G128]|uniref:hypothetical protein n=1 Tax=Aquihabitans sp. G128 TaxID=2849779 RepID=UPI001C245F36|nr:hypothetical protein [Aquihabitans sp. G128]QXC60744.1 hypothetical protein KSP35_20860 [Aquihabitans sp. G128]
MPEDRDAAAIDPLALEPGADIVVHGRRLTVAMVVPRRSGFDIAPTCGAPVFFDPATDEPIRHQ